MKPVVIGKKDTRSTSFVQLHIPTINEENKLEGIPFDKCSSCGVNKYRVQFKGFYPKYKTIFPGPIFKGKEYFGPGKMAFRQIFINQDLRKQLVQEKVIKKNHGVAVSNLRMI